jgi:hypothetical protein
MDRIAQVATAAENTANCNKLLYNEKNNVKIQLPLDSFFSRKEQPGILQKTLLFELNK